MDTDVPMTFTFSLATKIAVLGYSAHALKKQCLFFTKDFALDKKKEKERKRKEKKKKKKKKEREKK